MKESTKLLKRIIFLELVSLFMLLVILCNTIPASAACQTPGCVKRAALTAMDESGMDICLVIKLNSGCNGKGTAYMMYKNSKGKVHCDRSGAVIVGKNEKVRKNYHYSAYRNRAAEKDLVSWKNGKIQYRERYISFIECAEGAAFNLMIHSYIEYKNPGAEWKICKGVSRNVDGVAMCKEFAHYLRSMLDPDTPVVFL